MRPTLACASGPILGRTSWPARTALPAAAAAPEPPQRTPPAGYGPPGPAGSCARRPACTTARVFGHRRQARPVPPGEEAGADVTLMRLDAGLVLGVIGAGGVDQHLVVAGQLRVRPVDLRVVQVRLAHAGLKVVGHDPARAAAEELKRPHVRLHPGPLIHADHRADEQVPRAGQHHRERPDPPPALRPRVDPQAQVAVVDLGLLAGRERRPPHLQLRPPGPLGEMRSHVAAHAGHAGLQPLLVPEPLVDHRHRNHAQQLLDPIVADGDLTPGGLPQPGVFQRREPLPRPGPPRLGRDRRAARRQPSRLGRGHVLADRLGIHAKAAGHLHLRPAAYQCSRISATSTMVNVLLAISLPPSSPDEHSLSSKDQERNPPATQAGPRENADRGGRELPDRSAPSGREFRDRQHSRRRNSRGPAGDRPVMARFAAARSTLSSKVRATPA